MFEYLKYATHLKHSEFILNPEERQLMETARLAYETKEPFYYEALAGLGRQLTQWGDNLQARYARAGHLPFDLTPFESASK